MGGCRWGWACSRRRRWWRRGGSGGARIRRRSLGSCPDLLCTSPRRTVKIINTVLHTHPLQKMDECNVSSFALIQSLHTFLTTIAKLIYFVFIFSLLLQIYVFRYVSIKYQSILKSNAAPLSWNWFNTSPVINNDTSLCAFSSWENCLLRNKMACTCSMNLHSDMSVITKLII